MDHLASQIVAASADLYKKECETKQCDLIIGIYHNTYRFTVSFTPMKDQVLIKFRTMAYRVARKDVEGFEEIVNFLLQAIQDEIREHSVRDEVDVDDQDAFDAGLGGERNHRVTIMRHSEQVWSLTFDEMEYMDDICRLYTKSLRFLN